MVFSILCSYNMVNPHNTQLFSIAGFRWKQYFTSNKHWIFCIGIINFQPFSIRRLPLTWLCDKNYRKWELENGKQLKRYLNKFVSHRASVYLVLRLGFLFLFKTILTIVYKENKNLKSELEILTNICFCPFFVKHFKIVLLSISWEKSITKVRNIIAFII